MTEEKEKPTGKEETKKLPIPNDDECEPIIGPDGEVIKACPIKWCPIKPTGKPAEKNQPDKK